VYASLKDSGFFVLINMNKKKIIVKCNDLVERAHYRLSVNEQRVVLNLISKINPKASGFERYTFGINELYDLLKLSAQNKTIKKQTLKRILRSLQRNIIEMVGHHPKHGGETLTMSAWIESPLFDWNKNEVTLRVSEHLKPYLLQRQKNFTSYSHEEVAQLKCAHSFRFLEFCKNNEPRPKYHEKIINGRYVNIRVYDLLKLRRTLGIPENIYPQLADFRKRVLLASQREVNTKTNSYFEFEILKDPMDRRKNKAVKLLIFGQFVRQPLKIENQRPLSLPEPATPPPDFEVEPHDEGLLARLLKLNVSSRLANIVLNSDYERSQISSAVEALEEYQRNHKIRSPNKILNSALLDGWVSKGEIRRQEDAEKSAKKLAEIETAKKLAIGLLERENEKYEIYENEHNQAMDDYQKRLEVWETEFNQRADKTSYILSLHKDFQSVKKRIQLLIEHEIERLVEAETDFDEVYFEAGQLIFSFLLPSRKA